MDYAILSGSRFAQFESEKAVTELFKILKWAKKNDRGTILFFDEADACFRDRKILDQNGINFVNAFLSETGTNSDKFMFVFASNYESELDSAILSRIHKKIQFPLPALPEREKILNQKITKYIINDKRTYLKNDKEVTETLSIADDVTPEYLYTIAQKIEGFSGRDIDYAVSEMRMRSYRSGNNTLTRNIIEMVITEKVAEVAKDKKISTYQDKKIAQKLASIVNQATAAAA
jgi:ATPase family AAA domain-containing protein 3A/B